MLVALAASNRFPTVFVDTGWPSDSRLFALRLAVCEQAPVIDGWNKIISSFSLFLTLDNSV